MFSNEDVGAILYNSRLAAPEGGLSLLPTIEDVIDLAYTGDEGEPGGLSDISYAIVGDLRDRALVIQWTNVGFYYEWETATTDLSSVSFQVWIYEQDQSIEYRYGPSSILNPSDIYEFIGGTITGLGFFNQAAEITDAYLVSNRSTTSFNLDLFDAAALEDLDTSPFEGFPQDGQVFRFAGMTTASADLSPMSVSLQYNNPVVDYLDVSSQHDAVSISALRIYNMQGLELLVSDRQTVDLSSWPSGSYIFTAFMTDGSSSSHPFIKQ